MQKDIFSKDGFYFFRNEASSQKFGYDLLTTSGWSKLTEPKSIERGANDITTR